MSVGAGEAQGLGRVIAGQVILPADPEYEAARKVWNGMIDKRAPSPYSMIALEPMGGAIARVGEMATAFGHRGSAFSLLILAGWTDAAHTEANVSWARTLWNLTRPLSSPRVYVNYLGNEGDGRVRDAFGGNHARLGRIKQAYDPANVFRLNQNIEPVTTVS